MTTIENILAKYDVNPNDYRKASLAKIADTLSFCEKKNIRLLSPVLIRKGNSINYIRYLCECGNEAESALSDFLNKTVFACFHCNAKLINKLFKPIKTDVIKKEIERKGYVVVSCDHDTSIAQSTWTLKCAHGHVFKKEGESVRKLQSCPDCFVDSYEEFLFRKLIEAHYKTDFPKSHPDWLVNSYTNRVLELDMYSEKLALAFEYNGIQHYSPIYGEERYAISVRNDQEKNKRCLENNVTLITIKYLATKTQNKQIFLEQLSDVLKEHAIFISPDTIAAVLASEYTLTNNTDKIVAELKAILKKNKREWVSGSYINSSSKIVVRCLQCNCEKETTVHTLKLLKNKTNSKCYSCKDKFSNKKVTAIKKHKQTASKICKTMNVTFDELQFNLQGLVIGFWYYHNDVRMLFGCKKYKKTLRMLKDQQLS